MAKTQIRSEDKAEYTAYTASKSADDDAIIAQALEILQSRMRKYEYSFTEPKAVKQYLTLRFAETEHEVFTVLFLTNKHKLIEAREMFRGTIDGASVHVREVVKEALELNAAAVILAHNHPSGVAEPSSADVKITERLQYALSVVDVRVLDHIIVGGTETASLAELGRM